MAKEILIADSDKADQQEFQRIFETTDYHLVFSESGEDVLLRVKLFNPDLIIAGMALGEKSGLEICRAIKTDPESKHIPFILISSIFEEISEGDRARVQADGVISKPLHEDEILNLVEKLIEEESMRAKKEGIVEKETEWKSIAEIGKITPEKVEELLLEEPGAMEEEETIDLVDVVGEPEPRISIDDFAIQHKEEPLGEITPLESWERMEEPEKPSEKGLPFFLEEKEVKAEEILSQLERGIKPKETIPEDELFKKIELEEILEKIESLKPSLEKEWPKEKETEVTEERPTMIKEPAEKILGLEEFEAVFQKEAKTEKREVKAEPLEEELQPFFIEEPKKEVSVEPPPVTIPVEEEELEELPEEEFPEELLEEVLGEKEIGFVGKPKEIMPPEVEPREISIEKVEKIEKLEEIEIPRVAEKRVGPLMGRVDKQMEEVIAKGVREMMEGLITKIVPEMTQNIIGLTFERIEKMVRDIVPDLAEKAIKEEIKRLQKEEKD